MSRPFIVIGDRTDHGGEVIAGSPESTIDGKPIARIGDRVTCPRHRNNAIASGDPTVIVDGMAAARDGDTTECGAKLIAGQPDGTCG